MSTSVERVVRKARRGGVIDYEPWMVFKAKPVTIDGVRYAELLDGRVVCNITYPKGLVWTGAGFEEQEIAR